MDRTRCVSGMLRRFNPLKVMQSAFQHLERGFQHLEQLDFASHVHQGSALLH